ncbi:MAG: hypothetical protein JJE09_07670 [Bacteroidia bacterium]|nr:hypothetical protein [Bacteroidia bacterium]
MTSICQYVFKYAASIFILSLLSALAFGQQSGSFVASDPATTITKASIDAESYFFYGGARYYAMRFGYFYGLKNDRHQLGMSLPFVHTIFEADYAGFENTTGIGDLKMNYLFVPYQKKNTIGLEKVTGSFEVTAPTGEYRLGRGAGTWLYKPGLIFTMRSSSEIVFYPEIKFQISGGDANSQGGSDGLPDPNDPDKEKRLQNLSVSLPMVAQVRDWDGWFSLNLMYAYSLTEQTSFLFLRTDFGAMIGTNTAASLRIIKFIAGQPRLNVTVQANLSFFLR